MSGIINSSITGIYETNELYTQGVYGLNYNQNANQPVALDVVTDQQKVWSGTYEMTTTGTKELLWLPLPIIPITRSTTYLYAGSTTAFRITIIINQTNNPTSTKSTAYYTDYVGDVIATVNTSNLVTNIQVSSNTLSSTLVNISDPSGGTALVNFTFSINQYPGVTTSPYAITPTSFANLIPPSATAQSLQISVAPNTGITPTSTNPINIAWYIVSATAYRTNTTTPSPSSP